jgi:AbiTii
MSLLREIQKDIADPGGDVISVLRKCKILATRLGSVEFASWIEWELNGYPSSQATPEYRKLSACCYASFLNRAWRVSKQSVPLSIIPEELRDALQQIEFREGIAKIKSFADGGALIDRPELAMILQGKMYPQMTCHAAWMEIAGSEFEQLVSAIQSRVLDFVLKIEGENPDAGEAPPNSRPVPLERLQPLVNNYFGPVGNIAQHSQEFKQTAAVGLEPQDLSRFVTEFDAHLDDLGLNAQQRKKAKAQIATIKAQLADEPDPLIVRQAGQTLRNVTEGAIGSLIATAAQPTVWHWIQQAMAGMFGPR